MKKELQVKRVLKDEGNAVGVIGFVGGLRSSRR